MTAARERPILFSGPMVRAILAGAKTQTRRLIQPSHMSGTGFPMPTLAHAESLTACIGKFCPYGVPGDRLWVRETWAPHADEEETCRNYAERMAGRGGFDGLVRPEIFYRANGGDPFVTKWRPSIFLPRWASRLTLEVLAVMVQRLQEISEADAKAEGCALPEGFEALSAASFANPYREVFRDLWNEINGKRAPWASNPWVWAVTFKRLEASDA